MYKFTSSAPQIHHTKVDNSASGAPLITTTGLMRLTSSNPACIDGMGFTHPKTNEQGVYYESYDPKFEHCPADTAQAKVMKAMLNITGTNDAESSKGNRAVGAGLPMVFSGATRSSLVSGLQAYQNVQVRK